MGRQSAEHAKQTAVALCSQATESTKQLWDIRVRFERVSVPAKSGVEMAERRTASRFPSARLDVEQPCRGWRWSIFSLGWR